MPFGPKLFLQLSSYKSDMAQLHVHMNEPWNILNLALLGPFVASHRPLSHSSHIYYGLHLDLSFLRGALTPRWQIHKSHLFAWFHCLKIQIKNKREVYTVAMRN